MKKEDQITSQSALLGRRDEGGTRRKNLVPGGAIGAVIAFSPWQPLAGSVGARTNSPEVMNQNPEK